MRASSLKNRARLLHMMVVVKVIGFLEIGFYKKLKKQYLRIQKYHESEHKEILADNFVIFDVGANRGQSVFFFKWLFPKCQIYSFEPDEHIFRRLHINTTNRQIQKVKIFNFGISNKNGYLDFFKSPLDLSSSFSPINSQSKYLIIKNFLLLTRKNEIHEPVNTPVFTIDYLCDSLGINQISILKVDVEGHELQVLQGARIALQNKMIKYIQLERQNNSMHLDQENEIKEILLSNGYRKIFEISHLAGIVTEEIYSCILSLKI